LNETVPKRFLGFSIPVSPNFFYFVVFVPFKVFEGLVLVLVVLVILVAAGVSTGVVVFLVTTGRTITTVTVPTALVKILTASALLLIGLPLMDTIL